MKEFFQIVIMVFFAGETVLADHGTIVKDHKYIVPCIIILILSLVYIAGFNYFANSETKKKKSYDLLEGFAFLTGPFLFFAISLVAAFVSGFILWGFYFWEAIIGILIVWAVVAGGILLLEKKLK
ncbi:hypothetical protein [Candidatus Pelagibacter sp.]|uniref:hypothetical protein n=1 Tax=Candidatus Pelagibacter sp. TaxID=2024849 RepID=UPI003F83CD3E